MATYYVSQRDGTDSGGGTDPASPYKTISYAFYALGNTTAENTIVINDSETYFVTQSTAPGAGGTNATNQIIATTHHLVSNLTITTGSGCKPVFDGDGGAGTVAQFAFKFYENAPANAWTIEGLRFQNFEGPNEYHAPLMQTISTKVVNVEDCEFYNISGSGIYCEGHNGNILRCKFENIEDYAIHMANGTISHPPTLIENCLIYHIGLGAIKATLVGGTVEHCTIYRSGEDARVSAKNRSYAYAVFAKNANYNIIKDSCQGSAGLRAANTTYNVVTGTTRNATAGGGTTGVYDYYNDVLGTGDAKATDPLLVNPGSITGSASYELQKDSPARGHAVTSTSIEDIRRRCREWAFPHSVNGYITMTDVGRYSMAPNDAGCYEYSPTSWAGVESKNIGSINGVSR
jgi:hypothetical protein